MIDARLLATYDTEELDALTVFGTWIPRQGDNLRCAVEVCFNFGVSFTVEVFEKNAEDVGDGVTTSVAVNFDEVPGRQVLEVLGCKEMVRFRLSVARGSGLLDADIGVVYFRFLEPLWFESVKV